MRAFFYWFPLKQQKRDLIKVQFGVVAFIQEWISLFCSQNDLVSKFVGLTKKSEGLHSRYVQCCHACFEANINMAFSGLVMATVCSY